MNSDGKCFFFSPIFYSLFLVAVAIAVVVDDDYNNNLDGNKEDKMNKMKVIAVNKTFFFVLGHLLHINSTIV